MSPEPSPENWAVRVAEANDKLDDAKTHLERALADTGGKASIAITEALRHIGEAKSKLRGEL